MRKLWSFLNSPLMVVLIALAIWPILTVFSGTYAVRAAVDELAGTVAEGFDATFGELEKAQNKELEVFLEAQENVLVKSLKLVPAKFGNDSALIGTIENGSSKTISNIKITVSYYENEKLIAVDQEWISNIKAIRAGESANFKMDSSAKLEGDNHIPQPSASISGFKILE